MGNCHCWKFPWKLDSPFPNRLCSVCGLQVILCISTVHCCVCNCCHWCCYFFIVLMMQVVERLLLWMLYLFSKSRSKVNRTLGLALYFHAMCLNTNRIHTVRDLIYTCINLFNKRIRKRSNWCVHAPLSYPPSLPLPLPSLSPLPHYPSLTPSPSALPFPPPNP